MGNSSAIGEMLTIRLAAPPAPGDRHMNDWASFCSSVQFGGTVHDMPCRSHFAPWPPAIAAVCAAVVCACSGLAALSLTEPPEELDAEPPLWSFSERLQSDNAKPMNNTSAICFMQRPPISDSYVRVATALSTITSRQNSTNQPHTSAWFALVLCYGPSLITPE